MQAELLTPRRTFISRQGAEARRSGGMMERATVYREFEPRLLESESRIMLELLCASVSVGKRTLIISLKHRRSGTEELVSFSVCRIPKKRIASFFFTN